jgi:hypothetical protein
MLNKYSDILLNAKANAYRLPIEEPGCSTYNVNGRIILKWMLKVYEVEDSIHIGAQRGSCKYLHD